jgi:hypothetical protein
MVGMIEHLMRVLCSSEVEETAKARWREGIAKGTVLFFFALHHRAVAPSRSLSPALQRRMAAGKFFARTQKVVDGKFPQLYISHLKGGISAMAKKKKTTKKSSKKSTKKKK